MDKTNLTLGVALVAVILAIGGYFYPQIQQAVTTVGTAAPTGTISRFTAVGSQYGYYVGTYGSETQIIDDSGNFVLATSTFTGNYWTIGSINYASVQVSMAATSSVPCSIPNPFGASTSTVLNYYAQATVNGLGSQLTDVSTSSTAVGSSSPAFVKAYTTTAGPFNLVWTPGAASTTRTGLIGYDSFSSTGDSPYLLAPNLNLNFRIATATPGTFSSYLTGTCSATFMQP